jgi:hypothetical protein
MQGRLPIPPASVPGGVTATCLPARGHRTRPIHIFRDCPHVCLQVFLGTLREIELERVKEKLSSAIMETCFALTIFRYLQ